MKKMLYPRLVITEGKKRGSSSMDFHNKTLSFNNTIGGINKNQTVKLPKRVLSKDDKNITFPKFNTITFHNSFNRTQSTQVNTPLNNEQGNDNSNNNKNNMNTQIKMPKPINNIQIKPTTAFANLQHSSLKYKIKKEDLPKFQPILPQPSHTIININHNINHNILINVNNTSSGKFNLHPINFKNIKITHQVHPLDEVNNDLKPNNNATDITFNHFDEKGNSNVNLNISKQCIPTDESRQISPQNSFLTKKSNESIKNMRVNNTLISNISSLKEQDTLLSYNYSEEEFEDSQPLKKSLFIDKPKKDEKSKPIDKEGFRLFCIDLDKKLFLIK